MESVFLSLCAFIVLVMACAMWAAATDKHRPLSRGAGGVAFVFAVFLVIMGVAIAFIAGRNW